MLEHKEDFDFSEYPDNSPYHNIEKKSIVGKFKDELRGELIIELLV